jgi:hypothetical protein
MTDCIIGGCYNYNYDQIKYWINSVNRCGFVGDKVLILFNASDELAEKVSDQGFEVIMSDMDMNVAPHVMRFMAIHEYLSQNDYRYVITTDVRDVVFQSDPVKWLDLYLGNKKVVVGSECLKYRDEPWGDNNIKETFGDYVYNKMKDNTIYNVGVIGGYGKYVSDLCLDITVNTINRPIKICDQAVFNFLVMNQMYKDQIYLANLQNNWAAHLGTLADPRKMDYFRPNLLEPEPTFDGKFVNGYGGTPVIAHQYDRTNWRGKIEAIYE